MAPRLRLLSLGAGVQSTTLALMVATGEFPNEPIDAAIFADTRWEPKAVYEHLERLRPLLPFPVLDVSAGNIKKNILTRRNVNGGRYASIPWFVKNQDGSNGMGRRQCTSEYKLKPIMHKTRELLGVGRHGRIPAGTVEQWIGISTDEATRMKDAKQRYFRNRWPLIERGISRQDCYTWLSSRGFPKPPKSACIGCPFHSQIVWQQMRRESPAEFEEACQIDEALRVGYARGMRGLEYMHPARIPLREAVELKYREEQVNLFENECEGMCGV